MSLKAVLFDFNGVIINDEPIHQQLIEEILLGENLRPSEAEYGKLCLGRSDRACLEAILSSRGRVVSEAYLHKLIQAKDQAYRQRLEQMETLPIYPGVKNLLVKLQTLELSTAVVTGALRSQVEMVLNRAGIASYFKVIVAADESKASKPAPDSYLLAVERLNRQESYRQLRTEDCLAIEDTPAGIEAAKQAGMQVVGVANTYPFHMLQRQANWVVDSLSELSGELGRVQQVLANI